MGQACERQACCLDAGKSGMCCEDRSKKKNPRMGEAYRSMVEQEGFALEDARGFYGPGDNIRVQRDEPQRRGVPNASTWSAIDRTATHHSPSVAPLQHLPSQQYPSQQSSPQPFSYSTQRLSAGRQGSRASELHGQRPNLVHSFSPPRQLLGTELPPLRLSDEHQTSANKSIRQSSDNQPLGSLSASRGRPGRGKSDEIAGPMFDANRRGRHSRSSEACRSPQLSAEAPSSKPRTMSTSPLAAVRTASPQGALARNGALPEGALPKCPIARSLRRSFELLDTPTTEEVKRAQLKEEKSTEEVVENVKSLVREARDQMTSASPNLSSRMNLLFENGLTEEKMVSGRVSPHGTYFSDVMPTGS